MVRFSKNIREVSWMSHGVMRFWFPLNFLFISASSDILASLSISHVFSSGFSGCTKSSCLDIPRTIIKFDKYFSYQSDCLLLFLEVSKNHYKKEKISVGGSEQRRDAQFWIHLRETWLIIFRLFLVALSFSTFIFSIGIKLFIQHPIVLFGILILSEQFDGFVQLPP